MSARQPDADWLKFLRPSQGGLLGALVLSVLMHLLMLLGTTTGPSVKPENKIIILRVELRSTVSEQVSPKAPDSAPVLQPRAVEPSDEQIHTVEHTLGAEQLEQAHVQEMREKLDKVSQEVQQSKTQEKTEEPAYEEGCISREDDAIEGANQMAPEEGIDGRLYCDQG